ncbi:HAMP domain-containing sensor histidine kinase [Paenibacillus sp. 598K]|uniref:HAMP domain-containing sensor histidine kinase n=1 Tax=Paenibacillus sp. 598K TaxID=1117987 RepID=UPI000FFE5BA3|nr:HAMP domain-containing sensor histidine kinase [Paenibacillus sp. 598K]
MRKASFFRRYLILHFLSLVLLPVMLLVLVFGVSPSSDQSDLDTANRLGSVPVLIGLVMAVFILLSGVFFYRLRGQLIQLQQAMRFPEDGSWIPEPVPERASGRHEVDQLASSFNRMIRQLRDSRLREQEEEALRKRWIANLSHDLRTPLTALRGHASRLRKEPLGPEGIASLAAADRTITQIDELMEELLSYTLLTSGKYPYEPTSTDVPSLVRASLASWYPVFEDAGFEIDIEIPDDRTFSWDIDPGWMMRVLDNLLQNVLRHAREGRYIGIAVDVDQERIRIKDRGPGMDHLSANRGAGIGLEMAKLMLAEMKLRIQWDDQPIGTTLWIEKAK